MANDDILESVLADLNAGVLDEETLRLGGQQQGQLGADELLLLTGAAAGEESVLNEKTDSGLRVYDPVDLHLLIDATASESRIIKQILGGVRDFADELYSNVEEKGHVRFILSLVRDHVDGRNWYEALPATDDMDTFARQLRNVRCFGGGDIPEALECGWYEVGKRVQKERQTGRKNVVLTVSSSLPHDYFNRTWITHEGPEWGEEQYDGDQQKIGISVSRRASRKTVRKDRDPVKDPRSRFSYPLDHGSFRMDDLGCKLKRDYAKTWKALTAAVDGNYFVSTSKLPQSETYDLPMEDWQRECVMTGDPKEHFLALKELSELTPTFMAAVRRTQSPEALQALLETRYESQPQLTARLLQLTSGD